MLRRYRQGEAAIPGFLEDYALFTQALLDLYEAQFDRHDLEWAVRLAEKQSALFEDRPAGSSTPRPTIRSLVLRLKEDYDGAEPSGNSIAILNLLRLAQITGRERFSRLRRARPGRLRRALARVPVALPDMLTACEFYLAEPRQIVVAGPRDAADTRALLRASTRRFVANRSCCWRIRRNPPRAGRRYSRHRRHATRRRHPPALCLPNYACELPVTEAGRIGRIATIEDQSLKVY